MTESVRNLFMSAQTQSHVSHVVWQAAKTSFLASYRNGNLSSEVYNEVKLDLVESEGRDITEVAKLFRKRCRFFANNFENVADLDNMLRQRERVQSLASCALWQKMMHNY